MSKVGVTILQESFNDNHDLITYDQFGDICRTCLATGEIASIFNSFYAEESICNLLGTYTTLELHRHDNLPQNICHNCLKDLIGTHLFIKKCQRSNTILSSIINSKILSDMEIKENDGLIGNLSESLINVPQEQCNSPKSKELVFEGPPYECQSCHIFFENFDLLRTHRREHKKIMKYPCRFCSKNFMRSKLQQHMRTHTKEKPYKCEICTQSFSISCNLKRHMRIHSGEKPYVCDVCGLSFIQSISLQHHKLNHIEKSECDMNSPKFICEYCNRRFRRVAHYNAHLIKSHSTLKQVTNQEYECDICKKSYKTEKILKAHQLRHGEKTFLCSYCGKGFITKINLDTHLKIHTGEKPHVCSICNKSFRQSSGLDMHVLTHTGEKPFKCNVCEKGFSQSPHLKYHLRTHSGEKPYSCIHCGKKFASKGTLTVHIRTHTGDRPYLCTICGKGFYDSSSMKKHKKGH